MIGKRFIVPQRICESEVVQVVGQERSKMNCRIKQIGEIRERVYWCCEVTKGKTHGPAFAVADSEIEQWQEISEEGSQRAEVAKQRKQWNEGL